MSLPKIDLDLVRQYCSLDDDTANDKLLQQYLVSAFDVAEMRTGRFFTESEVVVNEFDDHVYLKSKYGAIIEVKFNGAVTTSYTQQGAMLGFDSVGAIDIKYSTIEDVANSVLTFILKYILHQLERNNPDRGELDYSDLAPFVE